MPKATETLGAERSTASQQLSAKNKPSGRVGSPALTVKKRTEYNKIREERDIGWEPWLNEIGYGLGDNNHVYKK